MTRTPDPIERLIADALDAAGIRYTTADRNAGRPARDDDVTLDFHLVDEAVYLEVKQFHSMRIAAQMQHASDVIVIQGAVAARFFATLLRAAKKATPG